MIIVMIVVNEGKRKPISGEKLLENEAEHFDELGVW